MLTVSGVVGRSNSEDTEVRRGVIGRLPDSTCSTDDIFERLTPPDLILLERFGKTRTESSAGSAEHGRSRMNL